MPQEVIDSKKNVDAINQAVADFEAQADVSSVDSFALETYGANRVFINVTYTVV